MSKQVLILGSTGNFGKRIATLLADDAIPLILAGRHQDKLLELQKKIKNSDIAVFDLKQDLDNQLNLLRPFVVINTCGPFQLCDFSVAKTCIKYGIHYIDLSDGREFVNEIIKLNDEAKAKNCVVISGASTVPGLSSAVVEHFQSHFSSIESLRYGISPGQRAERGLATTKAMLSYLGQPLKMIPGDHFSRYGWQDNYRQTYPILGNRWMANCDIPDLDLLPHHFNIKKIHFSAGMENNIIHLGMTFLSYLVRYKMPINLVKHAKFLLRLSHYFDRFGSDDGGMHMVLQGLDQNNQAKQITWYILGLDGDGPYIPTIPAVILAKQLCRNEIDLIGAMPCVGLVSLKSYLDHLKQFNIKTFEEIN